MNEASLILHGQPFLPKIEATPGFIKCLIRDRWLVVTPEEQVRQHVLALLKQELATIYPNNCDVLVEARDIDIMLRIRATHADFQPPTAPFFIIETKHPGIEPLDSSIHEQQLFKYLRRTGCSHGALLNGRSAWLYTYGRGDVEKRPVGDMSKLTQTIVDCHADKSKQLRDDEQLFFAGRRGHFASFQQLVERYGKHAEATIRVRFEKRGKLVDETGFLFRIANGTVRFMPRNREQSAPSTFSAASFRSLVAIMTLGTTT